MKDFDFNIIESCGPDHLPIYRYKKKWYMGILSGERDDFINIMEKEYNPINFIDYKAFKDHQVFL